MLQLDGGGGRLFDEAVQQRGRIPFECREDTAHRACSDDDFKLHTAIGGC